MTTYLCEKIQAGVINERFYRQGSTQESVRETLETFVWSEKGDWRVVDVCDLPDNDEA